MIMAGALPVCAQDVAVQYFQTSFPPGLRYSQGWYGTFEYAPPAHEILLFDDDRGICIFSMEGKAVPSKPQGGTSVKALDEKGAQAVLSSYSYEEAYEPYDAEIKQVIEIDHYYHGVSAGQKLADRWAWQPQPKQVKTVLDETGKPVIDETTGEAKTEEVIPELTQRQKDFLEEVNKPAPDLTAFDPPRYAILTTGNHNWNDTATWSSTADGLTTPASVPASADSVYPSAICQAGTTLTVNVTAICLDMDWTGATNNPTFTGASSLVPFGSVTGIAAMVWSVGNVDFRATSGKTITFGTTWNCGGAQVIFNATGSWTFQDTAVLSNGSLRIRSGTVDTNGQTVTCTSFLIEDATAKTITLGASTVNCTAWNYSGSNLTLTANTSTINVTGTGAFAGGGITTYNNVNLNGTAHTVSGSNTFANLARNGTATKTDSVTFTAGTTQTVTSTLTLAGDSTTNRLNVISGTLGSPATLNAATVAASNADFMDITGSGAGDWDISACTGGSGDCGGNTGITFTPSAAQISAANGNLSALATWQDGVGTDRVPLPQDDWTCSHNLTVDMPRIGRSIEFTGTPTVSLSNSISNYGSFTLVAGMTFTPSTYTTYFRGRDTYSVTSAGKTFYNIYQYTPGGTITLQDAFAISGQLYQYTGTFNTNNFNVTLGSYDASVDTLVRSLVLGSSTITLNGTGAMNKWNVFTAGAKYIINSGSSTIILTNSGAGAQSFTGSNLIYHNITIQGAGNYTLTITGSNTLTGALTVDRSAAKTITFTAGTTTTVADFVCAASGATVATLTGAGAWNLVKSGGGYASVDYMTILNSHATPADATWFAGTHSTDSGGNTGWIFDDPSLLTVTTNAASGITDVQAIGNATLTKGDFAVTVRGFEWDIDTGAPYANDWNEAGNFNTGAFSHTFTALDGDTTHYFRAYATDTNGTVYGGELSFTTAPGAPTDFTITVDGNNLILAWTKHAGETVIVRGEYRYPESLTDGTVVYDGPDATYTDIEANSDILTKYYSAWGHTALVYSGDTPAGFAATPDGNNLDLTWTRVAGSEDTVIIRGEAPPGDVADGIEIYRGPDSAYTDAGANGSITWEYGLWATLPYTYSTDYTTALGGGDGMTELATAAGGISQTFTLIASLAFLALMLGLAYWRKDSMLYLIAMIGVIVVGWQLATVYLVPMVALGVYTGYRALKPYLPW